MVEDAGYNWAYERLSGNLVLATNQEDGRILSTPLSKRPELLHQIALNKFPSQLDGVKRCCDQFAEHQRAKSAVLNAAHSVFAIPSELKCKECGLFMHEPEAHMDMHYRLRCLFSVSTDVSKVATLPATTLSSSAATRLLRESQQPDLKPATRKRMLTQLQPSRALEFAPQGCMMMRGWFASTKNWTQPPRHTLLVPPKHDSLERFSKSNVVPADVIAYGQNPCLQHPKRSFWQCTFPKMRIPYHWQPFILLDDSALCEPPPVRPPKRTYVTVHNVHTQLRCQVCGEIFCVVDAPQTCKRDYILQDATRHKDFGLVHTRCEKTMHQQKALASAEVRSLEPTDSRRCFLCGERFILQSNTDNSYTLVDACIYKEVYIAHTKCLTHS